MVAYVLKRGRCVEHLPGVLTPTSIRSHIGSSLSLSKPLKPRAAGRRTSMEGPPRLIVEAVHLRDLVLCELHALRVTYRQNSTQLADEFQANCAELQGRLATIEGHLQSLQTAEANEPPPAGRRRRRGSKGDDSKGDGSTGGETRHDDGFTGDGSTRDGSKGGGTHTDDAMGYTELAWDGDGVDIVIRVTS